MPRPRRARPADFARRDAAIARLGAGVPWRRRARRALRSLGRALSLGLALAPVAVIGVVLADWLHTTPLFSVTRVEVVGAKQLREAAVLDHAGIEPGTNLFVLDPEAIRDRVEGLAGVRRAHVVRELPGRVLVVVEERKPYALLNVADAGGLVWIDADGYLVGPERRPPPTRLPILSGTEPPPSRQGVLLADRLHAGLALLRAVERIGGRLAGRISEIDVARAEDPVLYTLDGVEVRVGRESWGKRLARLDGVLEDLDQRGEDVESVDLRFRDLVVLRPRSSGAATEVEAPGRDRPAPTTNLLERR